MKRVLSLLLLVSCLFNCAASSFAEEYMLYEEPTEVLTDEEFVTFKSLLYKLLKGDWEK